MHLYKLITLIALVAIIACSKDELPAPQECSTTRTYTDDVKAIMDQSCAISGCHDASTKASGIELSDYDNTKSESERSRFLGSIRHESGFDRMPEGADKLSDANIEILECWIQNGQPE